MTINNQDITSNDLGIFVEEHEAIIAKLFLIKHGDNVLFNTSVSQWAVLLTEFGYKQRKPTK